MKYIIVLELIELKVLLTGFKPFAGEKINPAMEVLEIMEDKIADTDIITTVIPTVFYKSIEKLEQTIKEYNPDIVICLGQAGSRYGISVERIAINVDDARIEDNEGNKPVDKKIYKDGKNAYFSNLPVKDIVREIKKAGLPASISNSAGTYVCNHLMYGLLYLIDKKYPDIKGGFIHIPYLPCQVVDKKDKPSMSLEDIKHGVEIGIKVAVG